MSHKERKTETETDAHIHDTAKRTNIRRPRTGASSRTTIR